MDSPELEYAGFWMRVWASLIDTVLVCALIFPLLTVIYGRAYWDSSKLIQGPIDFLLSWVAPAVAVVLFWIARTGNSWKDGHRSARCRRENRRQTYKWTTDCQIPRLLRLRNSALPWPAMGGIRSAQTGLARQTGGHGRGPKEGWIGSPGEVQRWWLTLPSSGRLPACFARFQPPLMSNVRAHR